MRSFIFLTALAAFTCLAANLSAAEISQGQLAAIGLGNMKALPQEVALQVRGKGLGDDGGRWNENRGGWNSYGDHHHHHHHHQAHCQAPSHCQPCVPTCHVACGPCSGINCAPAAGLH